MILSMEIPEETEYLYHGTSRAQVEGILRDGLRGPSYWGTQQVAEYYAEVVAEEEEPPGEEVIIRKPLSAFNVDELDVDHNSVAEPLTYLLGEKEEMLYARYQESAGDWRASFRIYESVRYMQPIAVSPEEIEVVNSVDWE